MHVYSLFLYAISTVYNNTIILIEMYIFIFMELICNIEFILKYFAR